MSDRQAALTLLANDPLDLLAKSAGKVLAPGQPSELQVTAVQSISSVDDPSVTDILLENWSSYTPLVRSAVIDAIFSRTSRLSALIDAIDRKQVAAHEIDAFHRVELRESKDAKIRKRAQRLLTEANTGASDQVVAEFLAALDGPQDSNRGEAVFKKICATCHRLNNVGHSVGPDLAAAKGRADETLLMDILRPSRQITPKGAADLIGFLRKSLGPAAPISLTSFDEDADFPTSLNEGTGTARLDHDDPFVGKVSLLVTPPQRFSPRIDGWNFRIREKPQPGEFRYLRFAWKTASGKGIMLEFADDGQWPLRREKLRRYLSGENTTRWGAIELSPDPPTEWTIVTRDLWKDFGDLTLTGIAPTAMDGSAHFDRIELLRSLDIPATEKGDR